jgi:hypothetical protein
VGAASKELGKPLADVFRFLPPTSPSFGLVELKTKTDPRATRVAVILVGGAVIPIIVRVPPVMVGVIVPIILACVITMMAAPRNDRSFCRVTRLQPRSEEGLDRHQRRSGK